ncbi:MAG TPA: NAD(P)-binding domain-containing protein [Verrucomicrobiae bacterium]|jgi:6-phosphogluconate dehydrogenase
MAVSDATQSEVGVIGLDLSGRNVAHRLAEERFNVAAFDSCPRNMEALRARSAGLGLRTHAGISEVLASLRPPRTLFVFNSAAASTAPLLEQLLLGLKSGDIVLDGGASYFKEAAQHAMRLSGRGVEFMGIGLCGGEKAARHRAGIVAGGGTEARRHARPVLAALAPDVRGECCISYVDSPAAAHFAKMVHTGIDYALMQLLSETFDLLHHASLAASDGGRAGVLNGYLVEVAGRLADAANQRSLPMLLRENLEFARTDALGKWLGQAAWELQVLAPTIEAAVEIHRVPPHERRQALLRSAFRHPARPPRGGGPGLLDELHGALQAAMVIAYAQGFALMAAASEQFGFRFNLHEISRVWRGCTHLRAALLDDIATAFEETPGLPGLLSDDTLSERVMACQEHLRRAVWRVRDSDLAVPALLASLDYLDSKRTAWLPVNLIQAARRAPAQLDRER